MGALASTTRRWLSDRYFCVNCGTLSGNQGFNDPIWLIHLNSWFPQICPSQTSIRSCVNKIYNLRERDPWSATCVSSCSVGMLVLYRHRSCFLKFWWPTDTGRSPILQRVRLTWTYLMLFVPTGACNPADSGRLHWPCLCFLVYSSPIHFVVLWYLRLLTTIKSSFCSSCSFVLFVQFCWIGTIFSGWDSQPVLMELISVEIQCKTKTPSFLLSFLSSSSPTSPSNS